MNKACITTITKKIWVNKIFNKKNVKWLCERYKQPDWCGYTNALNGLMGCWSLTSWPYKMSKKHCKICDEYKELKKK